MMELAEGRLLERRPARTENGEAYAWLHVECGIRDFLPGQYVMLRRGGRGPSWPADHMIQKTSERGIWLLAGHGQALYGGAVGETVTLWGPLGRAPGVTAPFSLLCGKGGWPRLLPFVAGGVGGGPPVLWLGEGAPDELAGMPGISLHRFEDLTGAAAHLAKANGEVLAALPAKAMLALSQQLTPEARAKIWYFAGTQKICGVGACKGCYLLNSEPGAPPVNVCVHGPFVRLETIDLARDLSVFEQMEGGDTDGFDG